MDSRTNKGFQIPDLTEKKEKPWRWGLSKEGRPVRPSLRMRLFPNKYNPRSGKKLKNTPHCFMSTNTAYGTTYHKERHCKSCMWRFTCKIVTVEETLKKEPFIPRFQDSTGDGE